MNFYCQTSTTGTTDEATMSGGKVEVDVESVPISAIHGLDEALRSPKISHSCPPGDCGAQLYSATSPAASNGRVPWNGEQSIPFCSLTSQPQFPDGEGEIMSGTGNGFVSERTKLEVAASFAGFMPKSNVLVLPPIWKQGSPVVQRQASARYGAAIELVQHDP